MLRLRGLRPALLALSLALPLGACHSNGGSGTTGSSVEPTAPLPAPANHAGDLFVVTPGATWAKLRGSIGGPAMFLPAQFSSVVCTLVGMPITMSAEIDDAVPVVGTVTRAPGRGLTQVVIGVHVKAGDRFVDQLTRGESARFNAAVDGASHVTLLTDKVAPESQKLALGVLGNYLLVGATPADLYALGPYVVRTLGPAPAPKDEIAFEMDDHALAGPILDEVRAWRGPTEGAAASVLPLASMLDDASVVLGDATHARLTFNADASALHGRVAVTPRSGGPASKLIAEMAVGDTKPLLELPDGTTVALLWREPAQARKDHSAKQAGALARMLGSGVSEEDRAAMAAALGAEAEARGDWQAFGVSFNGTGPTAVMRAPVSDPEKMRKALKQLLDLGGIASVKATLASLGIKLSSEKAVVENLPADITRVHLSRGAEDTKDSKAIKPEKAKSDPKAKTADKHPESAPSGMANAIDLLYFVDERGLFAAGGYDPKDSLRALVKAPTGANLGGDAPVASALSAAGNETSFVLVADLLRVGAMTLGGGSAPAAPLPVVIAAGHGGAPIDLWARADVPLPVLARLAQEYMRRRTAPTP